MISLKKYLESVPPNSDANGSQNRDDLATLALEAYGSALVAMGTCSLDACPGLGNDLNRHLGELSRNLSGKISCDTLSATEKDVKQQLHGWGRHTARHYQQKSDEVKELLIVMAHTAESVGARDQRCAGQFHEVTARLTAIASLDDLTQIRASIEKSAAELKTSIDRMTEEGKAAIDQLQAQVSTYRRKLEDAEEIASRDALTGLRNRMFAEKLIERRLAAAATLCVAIVDIDEFKKVNDEHGHLIGDELLKQFATELVSACRSTDAIGRWGGDEFIIILECGLTDATAQIDRLSKWVCGSYTIAQKSRTLKLQLHASIGLAEHLPGEPINDLLARADSAMYKNKAASPLRGANPKQRV
jgi:diguanylate cyclase (GGDEF)-like protein